MSDFNFAYSSNAWRTHSVEETIRKIAALGFTGIELLADVPHAWPVSLLPEKKASIRSRLEETGLKISNMNAFMMNAIQDIRQPYWYPSWIEPYAPYRAIRREHTLRTLHLAAELGAPSIQTEPGGPLEEGISWTHAADIFYDEIMPCVETAENLGILLLIEPEPGLMIERFEQYLEFHQRVNSPALGLNFDLGHAFCVGEDPEKWIPVMKNHTRHYHIEDISVNRVHHHLIPGHGAMNFSSILNAIKQTDYNGWITLELYPYQENPESAGLEALNFLLKATQEC